MALATTVGGCGDVRVGYTFGHHDCDGDNEPAIVVRFVDRRDSRPLAVVASGSLRDGPFSANLVALDASDERDGRATRLGGGFGRIGVYDVVVVTGAGQRFDWQGISVQGDRCGPRTVELEAGVGTS